MRRHELTDDQFDLLEPYLPHTGPKGGHPWAEHRCILNGLFWKLRTGAQWRDANMQGIRGNYHYMLPLSISQCAWADKKAPLLFEPGGVAVARCGQVVWSEQLIRGANERCC
jgi:hypothetical protein